MKSIAISRVEFEIECKKCHSRTMVRATEIARDGDVTLYQAGDRSYCPCGGSFLTEFQVAITADPVNRPVMKIVPAGGEMKP